MYGLFLLHHVQQQLILTNNSVLVQLACVWAARRSWPFPRCIGHSETCQAMRCADGDVLCTFVSTVGFSQSADGKVRSIAAVLLTQCGIQ